LGLELVVLLARSYRSFEIHPKVGSAIHYCFVNYLNLTTYAAL